MIILIGLISLKLRAQEIILKCKPATACEWFEDKKHKINDDFDIFLNNVLLNDNRISDILIYRLNKKKIIEISMKDIIAEVTFSGLGDIDEDAILNLLPIKVGDGIDRNAIERSKKIIKDYFKEKGFPQAETNIHLRKIEEKLNLDIKVNAGESLKISAYEIKGNIQKFESELLKKLQPIMDKPLEKLRLSSLQDELRNLFKLKGFPFIKLETKLEKISVLKKRIVLTGDIGPNLKIGITGVSDEERGEILKRIRISMTSIADLKNKDFLKDLLNNYFRDKAIPGIELNFRSAKIKREYFEEITLYLDIQKKSYQKIKNLSFTGNTSLKNDELMRLYKAEASVLLLRGYWDEKGMSVFLEKVKSYYFSRGFIFNNIPKPTLIEENGEVIVQIKIIEGLQSLVSAYEFKNMPKELEDEVQKRLINKVGSPLDLTKIESDIELMEQYLQEQGYYYSSVLNKTDKSLLDYTSDYENVTIKPILSLGPRLIRDRVFVVGLKKTRRETVVRELELQEGEFFGPTDINLIYNKIVSLGLFSQVKVKPFNFKSWLNEDQKADILIQVRERKFGVFEVAPGFRTDIGVKVSSSVVYSNLFGENSSIKVNGEVNQRLDYQTLDARRSGDKKKVVEYLGEVEFFYPYFYIFQFPVDLGFDVSASRRRFFSFDANIGRFSFNVSKSFNKHFKSGIKYQFEAISQYDATDPEKDEGDFEIGGVSPFVSLDFRDNDVFPRNGLITTLSTEFANKYFGSQNNETLKINFAKVTHRSAFYKSFGPITFALSLGWGAQKNFADEPTFNDDGSESFNTNGVRKTEGLIPSIKVFRLSGIDLVRGFSDSEINLVDYRGDKVDISRIAVQDTAYFTNIKFEPRYQINDNFMVAPFLDAGGLNVNTFQPFELRSAAGVSLKILTPVGSLDFDYGVKLKRRRLSNGNLEDPGRFHLSIGFF